MPAVHPSWRNVNSVCGRFTRFSGCRRLKLLNNYDWHLADSAHPNKSKPVERAQKGRLPVYLRGKKEKNHECAVRHTRGSAEILFFRSRTKRQRISANRNGMTFLSGSKQSRRKALEPLNSHQGFNVWNDWNGRKFSGERSGEAAGTVVASFGSSMRIARFAGNGIYLRPRG